MITRAWVRHAQCTRFPPRWWDVDSYTQPRHHVGRSARATRIEHLRQRLAIAALCEGCPVAAQCAAEVTTKPALMLGSVRAGVAHYAYRPAGRDEPTLRHLVRVAGGMTPTEAVIADYGRPIPVEVLPQVARVLNLGRVAPANTEGVGA